MKTKRNKEYLMTAPEKDIIKNATKIFSSVYLFNIGIGWVFESTLTAALFMLKQQIEKKKYRKTDEIDYYYVF